MTYYQATHHINPEGDVQISDENVSRLGIDFLHSFFGSLFLIAKSPPLSASLSGDSQQSLDMASPAEVSRATALQTLPPRYDTEDLSVSPVEEQKGSHQNVASVLIGCFPDIEYFVAGGIAGIGESTCMYRALERHAHHTPFQQFHAPQPHLLTVSRSISLPKPMSPRKPWLP